MQVNRDTPIWQLTTGELLDLLSTIKPQVEITQAEKKYVYGIAGIAELFGCSKGTATTIKNSGKIDKAITQVGRKIVVDAELALSLAGKKRSNK